MAMSSIRCNGAFAAHELSDLTSLNTQNAQLATNQLTLLSAF